MPPAVIVLLLSLLLGLQPVTTDLYLSALPVLTAWTLVQQHGEQNNGGQIPINFTPAPLLGAGRPHRVG